MTDGPRRDRHSTAGGDAGSPASGPTGAGTVARRPAPAEGTALRVTRGLAIPLDELDWRFTTSGGPGGQHANRSSTRAEVRFDIERSTALGPRQRARLLERLGPTVRVASGAERSQARNRELALRRLAERLAGALQVERTRLPTAPTAAARSRRLQDKRRQSARKRERSTRRDDTD